MLSTLLLQMISIYANGTFIQYIGGRIGRDKYYVLYTSLIKVKIFHNLYPKCFNKALMNKWITLYIKRKKTCGP